MLSTLAGGKLVAALEVRFSVWSLSMIFTDAGRVHP
jgi:hypothetical protein